MRKFVIVFTIAAGCSLFAQSDANQQTASQHVAQEDERGATERWKVINTAIFVLLLGFGIYKLAPRFFEARSSDYEIDSLRAEGARQVKQHTAQLALGLAEHRLISHFANNDEQNNVPEFVALVGGKKRQ